MVQIKYLIDVLLLWLQIKCEKNACMTTTKLKKSLISHITGGWTGWHQYKYAAKKVPSPEGALL